MTRIVPKSWMPKAAMKRIHLHWTAGHHKASAGDKKAYHILVEGDGKVVRGRASIASNSHPLAKDYAQHTAKANTSAIGVSLCCMAGVNRENDYLKSPAPMTEEQWKAAVEVIADLAHRYGILVTPTTILTHAEIEPNLHRPQSGKWDITRVSFDSKLRGHRAVGEALRTQVATLLDDGPMNTDDAMPEDLKLPRFRVTGVSPSALNFRRSPGGEKVGALPERTIVERLGIDDAWWRVRTRLGFVGYVHSSFLTPVDP